MPQTTQGRAAPGLSLAIGAAADYFDAKRHGDVSRLKPLLAAVWHGKQALPGEKLQLEGRDAVLARMARAGDGKDWDITGLHACFGDFAIVRADTWSEPATCFALMFRERGVWVVAGEASVEAAAGERATHFAARSDEAQVLQTLERYYRAVTDGDPDEVRRIFASCWHMKNHDEDAPPADAPVISEGTDAFAKRLEPGPLPNYWTDRQIADVQIAANRIAYVRVDRPSTPSTTVFLFARIGGAWLVIDKAWTDGRKRIER